MNEQKAVLRATRRDLRDHLIYSLALGTGLRLAEIVGLNVGEVYSPDGRPKNRRRLRREIAKNGRAATCSCRTPWWSSSGDSCGTRPPGARTSARGSALLLADPQPHLTAPRPVRLPDLAGEGRVRPVVSLPQFAPHGRDGSLPAIRDLFLAPSFARHVSPLTTKVYTRPPTRKSGRAFAGCRAEPLNR